MWRQYYTNSDDDLSLTCTREFITIKEMMKLIGKSQRTVARILAKDERIIRVGTTFDGYWKIRD